MGGSRENFGISVLVKPDFPLKMMFLKENQPKSAKNFPPAAGYSLNTFLTSFPLISAGGANFFGIKLPPHGRDPGGEVFNFPPMGETLGGKFFTSPPWGGPWGGSSKKLPPHAMGGKLEPWVEMVEL